MQTQDQNSIESQHNNPPVEPRKPRRWLAGLSAFLVVLLVVGASIYVFAAAGQHQGNPHTPAGQWKQVQADYLFLSMQAAPSNPAVLYSCVTTAAAVSNIQGQADTVLRSADGGDHWQNVGAGAKLGSYCDLAVSPTNENDIYVVSTSATSQTNATLRHSTDGGQTWTTITPAFSEHPTVPGISAPLPWFVQQLRYDGHSLYGVQWFYTRSPVIQGPPSFANRLPRLVTSADGGHTWRVIDGLWAAKGLGAESYALDATHPGTIYEIMGQPWLPLETAPVPTPDMLPAFGTSEQLFKSVDNGASWQSLLNGLPFNSQVQQALAHPQVVYVGGIHGLLPLVPQSRPGQGQGTRNQPTSTPVAFHLQVSTDGGASWQQVATPPAEQLIQDWLVSPDGSVYTSPTISSGSPGAGGTAVAGTPIVGTAIPATPVFGRPLAATPPGGGLPEIQAPPQSTPQATASIQRYDPASHTWSQVTTPPLSGHLLQVTPADTHGGTVLWYVGLQETHYVLYRYVV
jgi:hypothetical protein